MLNLNDIIALAKQGYKPSDIKELIELSKTAEASEEVQEQPNETTEQPEEEIKAPEEEEIKAPEEEEKKEDANEADKVVDYKKKAQELEKKLSDLQKANTKQNADKSENKKSDAEMFADVMKSFM